MTLFAALIALVLEQFRPVATARWVSGPLTSYARWLEQKFNDGQYRHGIVAWFFAVLLPAVVLQAAYWILLWQQPVVAVLLGVLSLYLTMGFRQFSHYFTDIQLALSNGEITEARRILTQWRGASGDLLSSSEVAQLAIEQALIGAHRHVFAPLLGFALIGPGGALFYRLSLFFSQQWQYESGGVSNGRFGEFSVRCHALIEWLPVRLTSIAFAVVGDFEDAIYCWRAQANEWHDRTLGVLLASGAGALGVRLGPALSAIEHGEAGYELGVGDYAEADALQSVVGLVWRTLMLDLLMLVLIWVAGWVG